jgi:exodeoxyribonuclease V alpha subunit
MTDLLQRLSQAGIFSSLDVRFARMLSRIKNESDLNVLLGAALAAAKMRTGDVCVEINAEGGKPIVTKEGEPAGDARWPDAEIWQGSLRASPIVSLGDDLRPLVLDNKGRLYLHRQYQLEKELAELLLSRANRTVEEVDASLLQRDLNALFGSSDKEDGGLRRAAETAVRRHLTVITGGPGSGKTTAVLGILLLIIKQFQATRAYRPVIEIVAPTGKAAQRLSETIRNAERASVERIGAETLAAWIPQQACTIHRLLADTSRHKKQRGLLSADVVVIDEASMVDLSLMHSLMSRIKPDARVIIVGDKDQLASVESGAVLADICDAASESESFLGALFLSVIRLTGNFRFGTSGGIGLLARAVNTGRQDDALDLLHKDPSLQVSFVPATSEEEVMRALFPMIEAALGNIRALLDAQSMLKTVGGFRVLTPHRSGPMGQQSINRAIEDFLSRKKVIVRDTPFYIGRPVMVTKNDYSAALFNGDVGVVTKDKEGRPAVAFPDEQGVRFISPSLLTDLETVFAMTVHKSQGSEFDNTVVVLPNRLSPVMVRELVYTAVTRAKSRLTVIGTESNFLHAITCTARRASGLKDRLLSD